MGGRFGDRDILATDVAARQGRRIATASTADFASPRPMPAAT
jgi:hypothetical protein